MRGWLSTLAASPSEPPGLPAPRVRFLRGPGADHEYVTDMFGWIVFAVIALVIVAAIAVLVARRRRLARSHDLREGTRVTISGVVQAPASLEAALSGRRCVMHVSRARVLDGDRLLGQPGEVEIAPFVVATRHGEILVDVRELAIDVAPDRVIAPDDARARAFRARHQIPPEATVAFDETVIAPGVKVTLRGVVAIERELAARGERGYRDDAPTSLHLVGLPDQPVTLLKLWQ